MGIGRRWVLPIIRIVIFVAIAAALVKLAFFGGLTAASDRAVPTGQVSDPTTEVVTRTIANTVSLDATITADDAVPVRVTTAGEVVKVLVAKGQAVAGDTPVATVKTSTPRPDGTVLNKTVTLVAGAAGTVSDVPVLPAQQVAVGDTIAQVAPSTFSVVGTIAPEQQYRLLNRPATATVTVRGGPQPFDCTGLTITTPLAGARDSGDGGSGSGSASSPSAGSGGSSSTTQVRCAVPAGVTVFGGLSAKLAIPAGRAENALAVPLTAVEGVTGGPGTVYVPDSSGSPKSVAVTLGVANGKWVQIASGLKKGDTVLEYVPGAGDAASGGAASVKVGG